MEEKLRKAIKESKIAVWLILVLITGANIIFAVNAASILEYLKNYWTSLITIFGMIEVIELYSEEKYTIGAEIIQWLGLGGIILHFSNIIITYIVTGVFILTNMATIISTILALDLIASISESSKKAITSLLNIIYYK